MRIATNRASSNYLKRLENNYSQKYNSELKISSSRKFQYASEMPAEAASAMRVRKAIANLNNYQENLKTARSIYDAGEASVMSISELIQSTYEKCIEAANGTHTQDQMEILANEIETFADEMCRLMNLTVADRRIFGGTNNNEKAFAIEGSGDNKYVTYNGVPVNQYNDPSMFPYGESSFTDIGLGMQLGADGRVDEQSAMKVTFNGMEVLGCGIASTSAYVVYDSIEADRSYEFELTIGTKSYKIPFNVPDSVTTDSEKRDIINTAINDVLTANGYPADRIFLSENGNFVNQINTESISVMSTGNNDFTVVNRPYGYSNNVIQNILDAAKCIRTMDGDEIARFADQVYSLQTTVSLALADFGHNTQFIEFNQDRITNNLYSLTERQKDLEATELESESTTWKLLDSIFSASLQMTSSAIPQSIFDFIR